ncbi:MAG: helix-turn-helix domain-containing protein [Candidatus Methanoperedens sp.]|jgi:predicted DNA binding protein|nr:helix-turn-helix domain-containing protein [Candidatus Methanoperedens sp.]
MREAILKVTMPDNWVKDVCKKYPNPIKFIECMPYGKSGGRGLIEIKGEKTDEIVAEIKKHPDVCRIDVSHLKNGVLGSVVTERCAACRALTGSDCFLTSASSLEDGGVEWKLITGAEGSLSDLIENLEENGCRVKLKSAIHLSKKSLLTNRQEEIIRAAFEKGYYDYPKKITIEKLAKMFDISPSTLGEIIQRGEKKIILERFYRKTWDF